MRLPLDGEGDAVSAYIRRLESIMEKRQASKCT